MIDFHTHILPNIDDGSNDRETSLAMLKKEKESDIEKVILTPHFYAWQDEPEVFLEKRNKAYESIKAESPLPLLLGAEVAYFYGISRSKATSLFTIANSEFILIEMPFSRWSETEIAEIENLYESGYTPIMAHIERFLPYKNLSAIKRLKKIGCIMQMNAAFAIDRATQKQAAKLIKKGLIDCIGSDCHNMDTRSPNLAEGWEAIKKLCGAEIAAELRAKQHYIFEKL